MNDIFKSNYKLYLIFGSLFILTYTWAQFDSPASRISRIRDSIEQVNAKNAAIKNNLNKKPTPKSKKEAKNVAPEPAKENNLSEQVNSIPLETTAQNQTDTSGLQAISDNQRSIQKDTVIPNHEENVSTAENYNIPISDTIIIKSLSVRDANIRDIISGLGSQYKLNIILSPEVNGLITVNLNNISLKKAIQFIANENGYEISVIHGVIKINKPTIKPPPPPPEPSFEVEYDKGKLSVDIKEIPLTKVVRRIVDKTQRTILVDKGTSIDISAYFKDLEFEKAIKVIVETNGLKLKKQDNILTIYKEQWVGNPAEPGVNQSSNGQVWVKDSLVSIEVNNGSLESIISSLTSQAGLNAVIYGQITGNITAKLVDIPIREALHHLFRGTEYTFWKRDGIIFIGNKQMNATANSKLIVLASMKADDILPLLPEEITKDMRVKLVPSQNALMAIGTYESIENLEDYIKKIDLPVAQILIEALVVDVDMDKIRQYGVNMFIGSARNQGPEKIFPELRTTLDREASQKIVDGIPGIKDVLSLPKNFVANIDALEKEKILKVMSRPQIATLNGKTAVITVGQTQYFLLKSSTDYATGNDNGSTTRTQERFESIQADVTLTVTPFVTGKGEITVEIIPDFSEPEGSFSSNVPPTINRRNLKSTVRLRQGETIILGGLVKESKLSDRAQFPFLGSIPILGWFFKNNNTTNSRSQLMIFVTPYIYYGADANVDVKKYIHENTR